MGRLNRFVRPDVVRLEISEGDWIEVKKELTVGEQKRMFAKAIKQMGGKMGDDPSWDMDAVALSFAKVETYLIAWSFAEEDGSGNTTPVELTPEAIQNLDEATFDEIEEAIDKHTGKMNAEKKRTGGKDKSEKT